MPKRMLIDASHPEETRVVVLDSHKVEEFDFEAASRRPLKGNIYLAKVTRVEPSLQAAFVEYGGNRQGFLAFSEIHPDYYQIPVADRQALLAAQTQRLMAEDDEGFEAVDTATVPRHEPMPGSLAEEEAPAIAGDEPEEEGAAETSEDEKAQDSEAFVDGSPEPAAAETAEGEAPTAEPSLESAEIPAPEAAPVAADVQAEVTGVPVQHQRRGPRQNRQRQPRHRHYKIQEVIKRRQILLVQVVKEERGTKGASLTTFLSLPGRYCVLMPNTPRGGGISRKITSATDRKRLKSAAQSLELPEGMGLIIRTAGANRTKLEIKRDYEYLLRLWDTVREVTLRSIAPALVYEEGSLIKRAVRDLYNKDIAEVLVDGETGYRDAKDFMRMIMPSHAKNVKQYKDPLPLFQHYQVEAQLDAMFTQTVTLRSGGYIVINQTEALVAIDVNSGKATREHSIEDTAYKTNLEAADEIARQLRLRDLAGLIVIDFIDMEDSKNDRNVEKRLHNAVKGDRARIQIGKISQFGLLEMSRQRLRAGVIAGSTIPCPHCAGMGVIRSTESAALKLIRALDEEGQRAPGSILTVKAPEDVTIYTLNCKRREIARIEEAYEMEVSFEPQAGMFGANFEIERTGVRELTRPKSTAVTVEAGFESSQPEPQEDVQPQEEPVEEHESEPSGEEQPAQRLQQPGEGAGEPGRRRRRRRRRGGQGRGDGQGFGQGQEPGQGQGQGHGQGQVPQAPQQLSLIASDEATDNDETGASAETETSGGSFAAPGTAGHDSMDNGDRKRRRRRRGRRGGRRREGEQGLHGQMSGEDAAHGTETASGEEPFPVLRHEGAVAHELAGETITPNAPSSPQWSLTEPVERRPEPVAEFTPAADPAEPPPPREQASLPEAEPPKEPRKGWWQRRFGL